MPSHPATTELHSIRQAADRLGYTYRHVRRLIAQDKLAARSVARTKRGLVWRITASELARFETERKRARSAG